MGTLHMSARCARLHRMRVKSDFPTGRGRMNVVSTNGHRIHTLLQQGDDPSVCWCLPEVEERDGGFLYTHHEYCLGHDSRPRMSAFSR